MNNTLPIYSDQGLRKYILARSDISRLASYEQDCVDTSSLTSRV